jgi:4-alpha-glucanotransferase
MKVQFNIEYRTVFGEELAIDIISFDAKGSEKLNTVKMVTVDGGHWRADVSMASEAAKYIDYSYSVSRNGITIRTEWIVVPHRLEFVNDQAASYIANDNWIDIPENAQLYSSAFTECIARHQQQKCKSSHFKRTLNLKVRAPQLRFGERLALTGDAKALGEWNVQKSVPMVEHNCNEWVATLDIDKIDSLILEYKCVVLNEKADITAVWEEGANRTIDVPEVDAGTVVEVELTQATFQMYPWKGAGTVIPVFSLRSHNSFGIGDFGDLKMMIDWVSMTRQRVLQILPINDTTITHTWTDSYPYNSISIYALHPQYADLNALPQLKDEMQRKKFSELKKELNELPQIDYERVNDAKLAYLTEIYQQEGKKMMASKAFKEFFASNKQWLVPYAAFCHYRDMYGTAKFSEWPDHHSFDEAERKSMSTSTTKLYKEVAIHYFIQFILDAQMREANRHAREKGVVLKGDIPIGISRDSVESWVEPFYFNLDGQAGAPPDAFSANGQNWGFPTYNWEVMLKDNCQWWVNRFRKMSQYFDAYRIDHILGFFRIWEIPVNAVHGLLGQFSPALPMSSQEIESYGLNFRKELFTEPFITDWVVDKIFGHWADKVRDEYLEHTHHDMYRMKPEYDTQRKVEIAFKGKNSTDDIWIRDGLYALISDVLFVADHKHPDCYHPRIGVQLDFIFQALNDGEKYNFNRLYNDYFYRRHNQFWYREAMKKLPLLTQATRMLVCGEDLGMVPDCVPWVMNELRILSLEIQSMPKDSHERFGHLSRYPYRSVCTISTHDMPTLRGWWKEDRQRAQEYYNTMLYRGGEAPEDMPGWLAQEIVSRQLTSPSMLCLLSLQDWLSIDEKVRLDDPDKERINIPANPRHYWRYRMHLNIEELIANKALNENISTLIQHSGRK